MMDSKAPSPPGGSKVDAERKVYQRESAAHLFRPITFRSVTARNRIMVSPMCQYSAEDGVPNDWHLQHLGCRAAGGAGIVCAEMTNVEARGRISPGCLGLWNDRQRDAFARIVAFLKGQGAVAGIQLAHAGRKASTNPPWKNGGKPIPLDAGGWQTLAPSALAFAEGYVTPVEMDRATIAAVIGHFAAAARRAREAGFDLVELHGAHGYLISTFLSPITNRRPDDYGGSFENRARFLLEVVDAVRSEWPEDKPLFVRLSCTDWIEGGWGLEDSVRLAQILKSGGQVDLVDCSSGGVDPRQQVPLHPGYQVPFAAAIRARASIATGAVGLISSPEMAEQIVASGQADLVVMARAFLNDPYWPLHAAKVLKSKIAWPPQYERGDIF